VGSRGGRKKNRKDMTRFEDTGFSLDMGGGIKNIVVVFPGGWEGLKKRGGGQRGGGGKQKTQVKGGVSKRKKGGGHKG